MNSRIILFPQTIPVEELADFVRAEGGDWQDADVNPVFRQGVFIDEPAIACIRGVDTQVMELQFIEAADIELARRKCSHEIRAVLGVDYSKGKEGERLADRISKKLAARWNGIVLVDE